LPGVQGARRRGNSSQGGAEVLKTSGGSNQRRYAILTAGVAALIVYGSLFPFEFYDRGSFADAVHYLLLTRATWFDRGDALSNIFLYIPLGLFGARAMERVSPLVRVLTIALAGCALSVAIEITQFWDLSRATEMSDVTANLAGALVGAIVEVLVRNGPLRRLESRPFPVLLLAAAAGMWLYPYVPSLHPSRWANAVTFALAEPFDAIAFFRQTVFWLTVAALLEELMGPRARVWLFAAILVVLGARFAIPASSPTFMDAAGALAGVILWTFAISKLRAHTTIVAAVFAAYVVVEALRPFQWLPSPRHFQWMPFLSFMNGPRGSGSRTFLEKTFTYGSLVWLVQRSGISWRIATIASVTLVLLLRLAQVWLPGRSAEITDALMTLILAAVLKAFGE
jgi:VanZ family protein